MNLLFRLLIAGAVALSLGLPATAQEASPAKKPRPTVKREAKRPPQAEAEARVETPDDLLARTVFQVILGEIALRRGDNELASNAYADLALRTRDPQVLERTIEVASYARRFDLAVEAARLWVDVEPESKRAQQMLVSTMMLVGQLEGVAPSLIRLLESDPPKIPENLLGLNRTLARHSERVAVFRVVEEVGLAFASYAEAHFAIAVAAAGANLSERAKAEARRALEIRPDWEAAAVLLAQLMLRDGAEDGIRFMEGYLTDHPKAYDMQLSLARALVGVKRYAEARRLFDALQNAFPDNPDVVLPAAVLALQDNDIAQAERNFRHLLQLEFKDKGLAYFYLGQIADDAKRYDEALAYYAAISEGDRYLSAQTRRAQILSLLGRHGEARRVLAEAKTSTPEDRVRMVIAEAALLREAKDYKAAFALLDAQLAKRRDDPDLLYESALMAERLGQYEVMEKRLRRLMVLQPDSPQAFNALGYSYADRNIRLAEARVLIEKALALAPNDFYIVDSLGWVLFRQGDLSGALTQLERAYAARPDPEVAAHLGEVLTAMGRTEEAQRILREAQKSFPESEVLSEAVRKFAP